MNKNENSDRNNVDLTDDELAAPLKIGDPIDSLHGESPHIQMATPNATQYPNVAGTARLSITTPDQGSRLDEFVRRRSWMGWFLWGDGTKPLEANQKQWDYFSFQQKDGKKQWQAIRMDQQPLYLDPLRINYNWPPGRFGFKQQPLKGFGSAVSYWEDKKIVRGINFSMVFPYLCNFGDHNSKLPDAWQRPFLTLESKPLETLVLVPGNKTPDQLVGDGSLNADVTFQSQPPFPYPVWDDHRSPEHQTPWNIKVDRMGDWDADLVWEATNPDDPDYEANQYKYTPFNHPGQGKYLKMTVAQGSPFIWCETHGNEHCIFYNLIRANETGHIDNPEGSRPTNPETLGPYPVPDAPGVEFVLIYGNQTNPNQFYHEVAPKYFNATTKKEGAWNPAGAQSNHTYFAVFYNRARVTSVSISGGTSNTGTDAQGNPYFDLKFKQKEKNWFTVAPIPVMSYYPNKDEDGNSIEDQEQQRNLAAQVYAQELGKYAFNFLQGTKISYQVQNMYLVTTTFAAKLANPYQAALANPYQAAGLEEASSLVAEADKTVFALLPHHYQPIELGPNPITGEKVEWRPLVEGQYSQFPSTSVWTEISRKIPKANQGKWGYWSMRGNQMTILGNSFQTQYLFQNFLPVLPPPAWETQYELSGIQAVDVTDGGNGYQPITQVPEVKISQPTSTKVTTEQATAAAILVPHAGRIQQIDVIQLGHGYEIKDDKPDVTVTVDPPGGKPADMPISKTVEPRTAKAKVQLAGDQVIAIRMEDLGLGYADTIEVRPQNVDRESTQISQAIITPRFQVVSKPHEEARFALMPNTDVWQAGAGYTQRPDLIVWGTGTNAQCKAFLGGEIFAADDSGIGGFTDPGAYPYIDTDAGGQLTKESINVHIPPSGEPSSTPATAKVTALRFDDKFFGFHIVDSGEGYDANHPPTATLQANNGNYEITLGINAQGQIFNANLNKPDPPPRINFAKNVVLKGGKAPTKQAQIKAYPQAHIQAISVEDPGSKYATDCEVFFSGGHVGLTETPELDFTIKNDGSIELNGIELNGIELNGIELNGSGLKPGRAGAGFMVGTRIEIHGGKGWKAGALAYVAADGKILAVEIAQPGSHYPPNTQIRVDGGQGAEFKLHFNNHQGIERVDVIDGGAGYPPGATVRFVSPDGKDPKGPVAEIFADAVDPKNRLGITNLRLSNPGQGYLPGSKSGCSAASPQALPVFFGGGPLFANNAAGFIAQAGKSVCQIGSALYDALNWHYLNLAIKPEAPFGAGFQHSSPDAYGIAGNLSASAKGLGLLYCLTAAHRQTDKAPWNLSVPVINKAVGTRIGDLYADDQEYEQNLPFVTLKGALRTWTQAMQKTLSVFFQKTPFQNNPNDPTDWQLKYFAQYDGKARRVVINPTGGLPGPGFNSTSDNPPAPPGNGGKKKRPWHEGEMWSGFSVSDQMNDQHYFFGYYLSTAGILAILDQSWEDEIKGKPQDSGARLWADPNQMGTAIDQLVMTLAYDPDKHDDFYTKPELTYQKMAFFDQWNGHGWASGAQPGKSGIVDDKKEWSKFDMSGTGSWPFDSMNENSNWEGNQAGAGIVLWGAGTGRKSIADLGIYLLATGSYAGDLYFYDKNYNLKPCPENNFSWVPVTTSKQKQDEQGNSYPFGSSVVDAAKNFAGDASCGNSTLYFGTNSLTNFFYAYPTGSKFIQSYPIAAWTLGMSRNTDYMKKWASSLLTQPWNDTLDTALFSAENFLAMGTGAALAGEPYFPGDINKTLPLINRLLSNWIVPGRAPGEQASMKLSEKPDSILHLLHVLDHYGTPDWTVYARNVDAEGNEVNTMVFTATFVKTVDKSVTSSLIAFNPGWQTAYVQFYRINADGTLNSNQPLNGAQPIAVKPKEMLVKTIVQQASRAIQPS